MHETVSRPAKTASGLTIHLSNSALCVLALAVTVLAGLAALTVMRSKPDAPNPGAKASGSTDRDSKPIQPAITPVHGRRGPWGELEYVRIVIERPDEFIHFNYATNQPTRWYFHEHTSEQLILVFKSVELSEPERSSLLDVSKWQVTTNGIYVTPGVELILGMNSRARQRIYGLLADWPENSFQHAPFLFQAKGLEDWFDRSGLSAETLGLMRHLFYARGAAVCFSDLPEVLSMLKSAEERKRLMKTLSRQTSILMKLRVTPESDIHALASYWGRGGQAKDIKPLLESLARVAGGTAIDIAHLLPPFARRHLYTFPYPSTDPVISRRNCFWTALNFFNEHPDDRYCDTDYTQKILREDYYPIEDEPVLGDIVLLLDAREAVVHTAVYLADDKVFTKNGRHFSQPWRIMDVEDMLAEYPSNTPIRPVVYRLKRL